MSPAKRIPIRPGDRYGRLTVIEAAGNSDHGHALYRCVCSCDGREVVTAGSRMARGETTSCGCYNREVAGARARTHGQDGTRIHNIWRGMVGRTTEPNARGYARYGGAGIGIDDPRWLKFENFYADMADGYRNDLTLERIDNSLGYSKPNCRWATVAEQNRNRRDNVWLEFRGARMVLADWAKALGLNEGTLRSRVQRRGWSVERALTKGVTPETIARVLAAARAAVDKTT